MVNIRYIAWGNPQQLECERAIIQEFNSKCAAEGKLIHVNLEMPPAGGYPQRLLMMFASGTAPDVCRVDHYNFAAWTAKGYIRDLTDMAADDPTFHIQDFHPAALQEDYYHGRLCGLTVLFGGLVCYYNQDLFRRAGLHDPYDLWREGKWTWQAFDDAADRLTIRVADGQTPVYGCSFYNLPNCPAPAVWALWIWREGGTLLSPDHAHSMLDSPEAIRGITRMRDMVYTRRVSPSPAQVASNLYSFEAGNVGMYIDFAGLAPRYRELIQDFQWDIVPTPSNPNDPYTMTKGNQVVISAKCPHPKEAWEWIKFLTSRRAELFLCGDAYRRCIPTRVALLHDPEYLEAKQRPYHADVFADLLDHPRALPIDESWFTWTTTATRFMERLYIDGNTDVERTMTAAASAIDQELAREHERYRRYSETGLAHAD